jgi:hypothetical protein
MMQSVHGEYSTSDGAQATARFRLNAVDAALWSCLINSMTIS